MGRLGPDVGRPGPSSASYVRFGISCQRYGGLMPIRVTRRVLLAARIWSRFVTVWLTLKRNALPDAVSRLASTAVPSPDRPIPPRRLGTMVFRVLRIGPWRPRCLYQAVVLFTLLRDRGE